jgi:hypothetical protein
MAISKLHSYLYPFLITRKSGDTFINVVAAPNYMTAVLSVVINCGEESHYRFLKLSEFVTLQANHKVHIAALDYGTKDNGYVKP